MQQEGHFQQVMALLFSQKLWLLIKLVQAMNKEGGASQVAQWERIRLPVQETRRYGIDFWVGKISWSRK